MQEITGLFGLFMAAFIAATIFPMQSEAVLVALLLSGGYSTAALLAVATTGNVLGAVLNWLLGGYVEHFRHRRWFPVGDKALEKAQRGYQRYGYWSLLLSWAPFGGDALTVVAGIMREPLWRFLLMVTLAKGGRYLVLIMLTQQAAKL